MSPIRRTLAIYSIAFMIGAAALYAQEPAAAPSQKVALVVEQGFSLHLILTEKVRFKRNAPVKAKITDGVYAFDREVIPPDASVSGRITGFKSARKWMRVAAIASGDFTPVREPKIEFDQIVLPDGTTIPIRTLVSPGTDRLVRFDQSSSEPKNEPKKGKLAAAAKAAREQIDMRKKAVIDAVKAPGKMERLKRALWGLAPYRPQYLYAGARFNAMLLAPLEFGEVSIPASSLQDVGSQPPAGSTIWARLTTPLDSEGAQHGMPVEAVLSRPLLTESNHLIFPVGTPLRGSVVQARPARHWHRSGKLAFLFTEIGPAPQGLQTGAGGRPLEVEARLAGVEVNSREGKIKMDVEGGTAAATSKKAFVMPAIALVVATTAANENDPDPVGDLPAGPVSPNYAGRFLSGGLGFGALGSVAGVWSHEVATGLGFYGFARSLYKNIIGKGRDVRFPAGTPIEIRFDPHVGAEGKSDSGSN